MQFWLFLIGLLLSIAAFFLLPVFALFAAVGDVAGTVGTLGYVTDAGSRSAPIGGLRDNYAVLMALSAASAVGCVVMMARSAQTTKADDQDADE
ncbi:sugar phosphate permease [Loktanella ponticola]|uniref:Sugar phosphate permease n=1 Tax=Yoonia ponticola TaxID=1524255 RepID=A0A7W9BMP5_9RHOB|nr:hypothetical protein [Yoonia ponticola]MBB5722879.1 sugar phosphate permease [Yoonia ponticola]